MRGSRITKRSVDALACPTAKDREFLWDDALAGFGVAAFPSGKKVYYAQYRKDGRSRRTVLGDHGRLTPDEARALAKKALGAVESGADPVAERRAARAVRTFREVAEDFLKRHMSKKKPRTGEEYRRLLEKHVYPAIGSTRIVDVTDGAVGRLHMAMSDMPTNANRALAVISSIWGWAAKAKEVNGAANPARGVERYDEQGRERFLKTEELARLGDALRQAETTGLPVDPAKAKRQLRSVPVKVDAHAVAAIRLLILTGARLREILNAKWSEFDAERGAIFLPDSKTGKKPIYLSAAATEVLAAIPRVDANPFIVAGVGKGGRSDLNRPWRAVRRVAGLDGVRIHDLRHTFASTGAGASLGLPIIGRLLGHAQAATTMRYAHLAAEPMRRAADTIGASISAAMNREPQGDESSNVVPIAGRRG